MNEKSRELTCSYQSSTLARKGCRVPRDDGDRTPTVRTTGKSARSDQLLALSQGIFELTTTFRLQPAPIQQNAPPHGCYAHSPLGIDERVGSRNDNRRHGQSCSRARSAPPESQPNVARADSPRKQGRGPQQEAHRRFPVGKGRGVGGASVKPREKRRNKIAPTSCVETPSNDRSGSCRF